jgi:secreted trypsin-like serine protease
MLRIVLLLAAIGLNEARPSQFMPTFSSMIIGGTNANPAEFPWQLSQQRSNSHSCGASLLAPTRGLSAAHCVDGANPNILRVIAGLHQRSNMANTQTSNIQRFVMQGRYNNAEATYSNDIAILHFVSSISSSNTVQFAVLPPNNNNNLGNVNCVISGWGRDSNANTLPDTLQKATIGVLSTADCRSRMSAVGGAIIWDSHICVFDPSGNIGSCNGDSGGPLNCPLNGQTVVAGVTSFGVSSIIGNCRQDFPSVYTRTSAYLNWINSN